MIAHPDAHGQDDDDDVQMRMAEAPKRVFTEEEKAEQKRMLEERIRTKRAEREKNEAAEALRREKVRREEGRMSQKEKDEHMQRETNKMLLQRKREREEDKVAKKLITKQLAADRARRIAEQNKGSSGPAAVPKTAAAKPDSKPAHNYGDCAIRFRLADGQQLTGKFKPTDTLDVCFAWLQENRRDKYDTSMDTELTEPVSRASFTRDDGSKTMMDIGCVPRGVLMVKSHSRPKASQPAIDAYRDVKMDDNDSDDDIGDDY